jgi:tetratricopeptide (TPR) repeat protein
LRNNQNSQELTIQQALSRAKKATKKGKIADAVKLYNAVLQQQPNHPIAKKRLHELQKELPQNQSFEEEASNPPQDQITALVNLYQSGQMTKTEQACRELLQAYPQSLFVMNVLGAALLGQGKLQEAVQVYNRVIQLKPDYAEAYSNRGNILKELGRLNEALQNYDKAIQLKPDYAEAYYNKGVALAKLEQLDEAVESYNKAIQLKPDFAKAHSNRGKILKELGRLNEALQNYDKAIQLKPDFAEAHYNMGNALQENGQLEATIESYKKAIKIKPDYSEARTNLAGILEEHGKYQEAIKHYDLSNTAYSKAKALQCLYISGCYSEFKDRLDKLAESSDINIRVAAVSAFVTHQLKLKDPYPFCKNSLDFLHVGNLNDHIFDVSSFIENLILETSKENQVWEPKNRTARFGFQTTATILKAGRNCMALEKILRKEIDLYHSKYSSEDCAFINSWPSEYNLNGWFSRLVKNGYMKSHIHPSGWLSGVVYLKTIDSLNTDDGSIELGLHGYDLPILDDTYPRKIHRPKPGDIILFPSSLFHRTIPYDQDAERCVIAFDLSRCAEDGYL